MLSILVFACLKIVFRFPMSTRDAICLGHFVMRIFGLKNNDYAGAVCTNSPLRVWNSPLRVRKAGKGVHSPPSSPLRVQGERMWAAALFARLGSSVVVGSIFALATLFKCKTFMTSSQGISFLT